MSVPTQWSSTESSVTSGLDTALTLRLPGSDPDPDCPFPTASASDSPPSTMAQVVGWPPVRSFRKNALPAAASWHRPCSVRLHGDLILSHGPRRVGAKGLDHRLEIVDPAVFESDEACSDLIHGMLADAPATAGYDLAEDNWTYSSPALTPLDIAMASVRGFRGEIEKRGAAAGIEFDIELPELWVTLVYSEPKALLLACKEAAAKTEATGRKRRRESDEPCAICLAEVDTRDEGSVTLPCSHAFHCGCIITWFHREWTCPTCRCDIMECFSFVRSPSAEQLTDDVDEDEPEIEEPWLYLGDRYVPFFHYPDDVDEASNSEDEFVDNIDFSDPELLEGEEFADSEAQSEQLM